MKSSEVKCFAAFYERHLNLLKFQGESVSTINAYSPAVRGIKGLTITALSIDEETT